MLVLSICFVFLNCIDVVQPSGACFTLTDLSIQFVPHDSRKFPLIGIFPYVMTPVLPHLRVPLDPDVFLPSLCVGCECICTFVTSSSLVVRSAPRLFPSHNLTSHIHDLFHIHRHRKIQHDDIFPQRVFVPSAPTQMTL